MTGKGSGKSAGKSRLSGKARVAVDDRSAKRHKSYSIKQFLQARPPPAAAGDAAARDSSEEPEAQLPSQTPAVGLLGAAEPQTNQPTVPGAKLQTALLRSLQHRFATQQALETPAYLAGEGSSAQPHQQQQQQPEAVHVPEASEEEVEEEEDGFQIFSQLAYEPQFLSQRPPADLELPGGSTAVAGTSQLADQTQLPLCSQQDVPPPRPHTSLPDELPEWPSSQLLSQPQHLSQQQQAGDVQRRSSNVSTISHKTTPALHVVDAVQCDGAGPSGGQKMFPMFRRRDNLKKLYIVRHGESEYNAAMAARGSSWADPQIFDAPLTEKGKQQARTLRQKLASLNLPHDTLWITSPLQRAMQTFLLACPHSHLLGMAGSSDGSDSNVENSSAAPNSSGKWEPTVVVLHTISEKVVTTGDIGHPASELRKRFPQLEGQLEFVPELWWHCPASKPNCALKKQFGSHESKEQVMSRIGAFRRWLQERPEKVIVAVGHSSYWRTFEEVCRGTKPTHMHNCEYRLIHF